ncbi:MAG: 16S rRNA pseudouridine516 synthase [Verrucomicrobiales bacterium]|jgi:16S rRNA pseudouridine516 synthase
MKLVKLLANLGYGSRKEVQAMIRSVMVRDDSGKLLTDKDDVAYESVRFRGEPLDPLGPLVLALNKPDGFTCSTEDPGDTIYDLLPERFAYRKPGINPVGRLDKDTTGLLLLTDNGQLLHKIIHPKNGCLKVYHTILDRPLEGHEAELFASGTLLLQGDHKPLLPAPLEVLGEKEALVTLHEGRYHQVRRMFAAAGNHVVSLKRISIGGFRLPDDLTEGEWRILTEEEVASVFGSSGEE